MVSYPIERIHTYTHIHTHTHTHKHTHIHTYAHTHIHIPSPNTTAITARNTLTLAVSFVKKLANAYKATKMKMTNIACITWEMISITALYEK